MGERVFCWYPDSRPCSNQVQIGKHAALRALDAAVSAPRIAAKSGAWQLFACISRSILQQVTGTKACELQSMFITTGWRGEQHACPPLCFAKAQMPQLHSQVARNGCDNTLAIEHRRPAIAPHRYGWRPIDFEGAFDGWTAVCCTREHTAVQHI